MMCNVNCVVLKTWSSSEKVEKVDAFCHPPAPWNALFLLCLGVRCVAGIFGYFQGASNSSRQLMFASRLLFRQKENRCWQMSTADYSCNIERKCAPPQRRSSAPLLCPFCMAESFSPGSVLLFRPTDKKKKQQKKQSSTPTPVSTLVMPSLPNIEVCHLRFISFSAGWLALALETVECLLDVMYWESSWVPVCCLQRLRCTAPCSTFIEDSLQ